MNTNPNAKTILCYGDSNTYGTKPDRSGRYTVNERWTGILQEHLGDNYYIIEEGLGGRTTNLEHPNLNKPSRNGLNYFKACLESHMPLDVVIIMLGTNDLKTTYNRSAEEVAKNLQLLPAYIQDFCKLNSVPLPKVILVSPSFINDQAPRFEELMPTENVYDAGSANKSRELPIYIQKVASATNSLFFDVGPITQAGEDGLHLDLESHAKLASAIHKIIVS